MAIHPTESSRLNSGQPPLSYSSVEPSNDTPSGSLPTPPGPPSTKPPGPVPNPANGPVQRPAQVIMSRALAICLAIILVQAVLIVCHSDTLAMLIDLKSAALRASTEKAALVVEKSALATEREKFELERERLEQERESSDREREKMNRDRELWEKARGERGKLELERERLEQERVKMKRDRELWEKAKEDRIPQGAFWDLTSPALDCRAYGKREYWATLRNVPEGWTATDACMNTPTKIKGVTVRRPYRCAFADGSSDIRGYWMVDWDEPGCQPWYHGCRDVGCTSYKSGKRRVEGELMGISHQETQDWLLLCNTTPFTWDLVTYPSPTHCLEREGKKFAMWDIPDDSCLDQ